MGTSGWELFSNSHSYRTSSDASLFSSSLPVLAHEELKHNELKHDLQSMYDTSPSLNDIGPGLEGNQSIGDVENHAIGSLLPDDEDELLAGIMDDFEVSWLPNLVEDSEEYDIFGSGGGLELESDPQEKFRVGVSHLSLSDNGVGNGDAHVNQINGVGTIVGEHPLGEHPSRTLFVRNINSTVEDAELRMLFELYGDIRTLYTACKHRGFVMISYYDIRAARSAMRALQDKPLRKRKLDIHFSIPKENPSDKDINQGTLVVFNLDPSVSNDDLLQIFGAYGEVKEIRETPHKKHHKFVEFYDIRAAEAALKSLNRSDIAGKRIKLEPSRPGGARRSLLLNPELEKDERTLHKVGSLLGISPPGTWQHLRSPNEHNPLQNFSKSPGFSSLYGSAGSCSSRRDTFELSHSLPEQKLSQFNGLDYSIGSSTFTGTTAKSFSGPQLFWESSEPYSKQTNTPPKTQAMRHPFVSSGSNGFTFSNHQGDFNHFSNRSQIHQQPRHYLDLPGSAPSAVPLKQHQGDFGFVQEPSRASFTRPGCERVARSYMGDLSDLSYHDITNAAVGVMKSISMGNASPVSSLMSSARPSPVFQGSGHFPVLAASNLEGLAERGRSRRFDTNGIQMENKKQYQLDLDKIRTGEDTRTTLMIKNIPNKYTSKMLLAAIDEHHKGTYDFFYLPIDFKNKCNVGYAFINLLSPSNIIPFYEALNGKKWEKFNSEKIASLAYARIQGKAALVSHFQHTSLMNEDKRCRPILFNSECPESSNKIIQGNFPANDSSTTAHRSNGSNPRNFPRSAEMNNDDDDQEKR